MSALRGVARQIGWEQKTYWRNPAAASFTFAFPLMFLIVFIAINGNDRVTLAGGTVKFAQYYVPAILSFGLISACYTNLAFTVSIRREDGLLKRVRGTPLSPVTYLSGMIGNVIVVAVILSSLVIALGLVVYGVTFPDRYAGLGIAIVFGAFCFSAIGILVSTIVPNQDAAPAIINFLIFPLLFISGTFGPVKDDSQIGQIAAVFPIRALNRCMVNVFEPFGGGIGVRWQDVAILTAWGLGAMALSVRRFRWDPKR